MLHQFVVVKENEVIAGKGLVAIGEIKTGEVVSRLEPNQPMVLIEDVLKMPPDEQDALLFYGYQCSETHVVSETGDEKYMNHSCDPNTWWGDDNTMIARRDIQPGEELTYDYATTEVDVPFEMACHCGSDICRGRITNLDHLKPEWQARFGTHLPQHTLKAIERAKQK